MLDMKKNTGAKVSALIGSVLALGTIFGLVSRSPSRSVADTGSPDAAAPSVAAPAVVQPSPTPDQQQSDAAAAPTAPIDPTATPVPQQVVRPKHTHTHAS